MFIYCINPVMAEMLQNNGVRLVKQDKDSKGTKVWIFEMSNKALPQEYELQKDYFISNRLTF
jgi:hypothetical protein